jgi:translation initiation factor IF-1
MNKQEECIHTDNEVIEELPNGYFKLKCRDCGKIWIDG